jgi:Neutral trehalase
LYENLFYDVQSNDSVFFDSKTFVDCVPKYDIGLILERYKKLGKNKSSTILKNFVRQNFIIPQPDSSYKADSSSINHHITSLWKVLKRTPDKHRPGTYIPLPYSYIVPGGRFQEIYYWDSYFTMLGLQADKRTDMIQNMIDNFSYLINQFGFIPNGNRTYYLGRSQAPFFALMIELLAQSKGNDTYTKYLPEMVKEHNFWMEGADSVKPGQSHRRVVCMADGIILNRYWDDMNTPRPEAYRQDIQTAKEAKMLNPNRKEEDVYRNLRAGAESGWDFSSRWLTETNHSFSLATIHTTDIIPVDLNCLLYNLETTIAKAYRLQHKLNEAKQFTLLATRRIVAIKKYCWNSTLLFYGDYDFIKNKPTNVYSLAGIYPLYFNIASAEEAADAEKIIKKQFLFPGGLVSTTNFTSQQWDAPNGWAPLQWMTIMGLRNYGFTQLADQCKRNWLSANKLLYSKLFKMTEKYNVVLPGKKAGGGEYLGQDGFGWTNGVFQSLSKEH